ncbi:L-dopachrome tautomerase-related protein [Asaia bogorensis]|uniref:L-dopachrome tautomerase-related protein n=1 Tax=Asaia bogorensis TaxID=91915 RepID=UPI002861B1BC|nr:L-dopachrome tautomerase-related protein [Asaia bogorensis]MDR6182498.1 sugar lactone lactonase YvrE [Asaia bogorensis NBRC 16594]
MKTPYRCLIGGTAIALLALSAAPRALAAPAPDTTKPDAASQHIAPKNGTTALEVVKRFPKDFNMIGVGVSHSGIVYASAPATMKRYSASVVRVDPATGALQPFPDPGWNRFDPHPVDKEVWVSVPALWVDDRNHLWVLDSSLPSVDQKTLPPKLAEFDAETGQLYQIYHFGPDITPADSLNDVRVDTRTRTAYITNEWGRGGLVVMDLDTGAYRLVLANTRSGIADPKQHLHIYGELARKKGNTLPVTQDDGIALSPDRKWLYYRPLTDHHYWRISTSDLRNAKLTDAELDKRVEYLGQSVMSGGIEMDSCQRLWVGDIENHGLYALSFPKGATTPKIDFSYRNPAVLDWADGFAIAKDWLYISDSRLDELAFSNSRPVSGATTIYRMKLPACETGGEASPQQIDGHSN